MKPITTHTFEPRLLFSPDCFWNCKTKEELDYLYARPNFNGNYQHQELLAIVQNNPALFTQICTTIPTMDGWATVLKACTLASLVLAMKPQTVVEIGVFGGRSLLPMAMACKANGSGKCIGIDPYDAQVSAKDEFPDSAQWWSSVDHNGIMAKFLAFVKLAGVPDQVELVRKKSDDVEPPPVIDLLHIDGSHMEQAVRDTERFCPKVRLGGITVFDDLTWVGGAVLRSMDVAEQLGFTEVFRVVNDQGDNWAVFQKVK